VSLVLGESEDAGDVVIIGGFLLFREITDDMTSM